jgi:hypothetical protein
MADEYLYPEEIKRDSWDKYLKNQMQQPNPAEEIANKDRYCRCWEDPRCPNCGRPYKPISERTIYD